MDVLVGRFGKGGEGSAELWLASDEIVWFAPAAPREPLLAGAGGAAALVPEALLRARPRRQSARRRRTRWSAKRKRRFLTRLVPTVTIVLTGATTTSWLLLRPADSPLVPPDVALAPAIPDIGFPASAAGARTRPQPLAARVVDTGRVVPGVERMARVATAGAGAGRSEVSYPRVRWRKSKAIGLPHDGRLVDGVQLPLEGRDWVTWDPVRDRVPNRAARLYGTDRLVRVVLRVVEDYRAAHPNAPRVVIGDLSRARGGPISEHASHENGLDVDVYYPRLDRRLEEPSGIDRIDLRLAQELVDRFVAAGAVLILVGQRTPLVGPDGVVVPYPRHDNHMHVRLSPAARGASAGE